jgi:hypothetical protein
LSRLNNILHAEDPWLAVIGKEPLFIAGVELTREVIFSSGRGDLTGELELELVDSL